MLRFSLHRLSALDIRNGQASDCHMSIPRPFLGCIPPSSATLVPQVKLEFLRALSEVEESRYLPAPAGPLVVLTFGEGGES